MAFLWLINGGDPNHLLTGMILQVWVSLRIQTPKNRRIDGRNIPFPNRIIGENVFRFGHIWILRVWVLLNHDPNLYATTTLSKVSHHSTGFGPCHEAVASPEELPCRIVGTWPPGKPIEDEFPLQGAIFHMIVRKRL